MKKLLFLVFAMAMTMTAPAQITWNVKLSGGIATLWGRGSDGVKPHFVAKAGFGIEKPLSANWSLMPSVEVAWKGFKFEDYDYDLGKWSTTIDFLYVQIPIMAAYRFNLSNALNMALKAGPYAAYAVYSHQDITLGGYNVGRSNLNIKKFDLGLDVGIDFEYHRFVFGVEGEMGFLKLSSSGEKNLAFYGTVGYKF